MTGEPSGAALAEARLVASSCASIEKAEQQRTEALIQQMRAELKAEYQRWHDAQPGCWQEYRAAGKRWKQRGNLWGDAIGESFGVGGLGLSGVGSGGGGVGYGMVGISGRGSGHGRLGGSHRTRGPRKASSASGTNNQVAGVDEADIVKTDGRYVYLVMNGALRIVEAMKPRTLSTTRLPGSVRELFVEGDRAVVYSSSSAAPKRCSYGYDCQFAGDGTRTTISVFELGNRTRPKLLRRIELSGSLMAARRIGNAVHTVVADGDSPRPVYQRWPEGLQTCGTLESTVKAKFAKLERDNAKKIRASAGHWPTIKDGARSENACGSVLRTARGDGRAFTTLVSFDLVSDQTKAKTTTIQSRPGAVFASADALYVSVVQRKAGPGRWYSYYPNVDEVSEVHKFHIGEQPEATRYVGSGTVPGHVLNQFSMDEWYGYLRIATTRGRVPNPNVSSSVSILAETQGGNLARVGAIDGIAPGEDIRSVRFDEDRGYVVTFKKTDPLFVIDLYDPARPKVLGELKIPGFSTYMHRLDADHLLSIGFAADDQGSFAYFNGIILQIFDVKNPTEPKLLHKETIGTRGSSSEAATNHLAFNYFAERGLLAIPMTLCEGGGNGRQGTLAFSGLLVYRVSTEGGFQKLGGVDHGTHGVNCNSWWTQSNSAVQRSLFLDELVYSIATDRLKVQKLGAFGKDVAEIALRP